MNKLRIILLCVLILAILILIFGSRASADTNMNQVSHADITANSDISDISGMYVSKAKESWDVCRFRGFTKQPGKKTCGVSALANILTGFAKADTAVSDILSLADRISAGASILELREAARLLGYGAENYLLGLSGLSDIINGFHIPVILHLQKPSEHYVIALGFQSDMIVILDPAYGLIMIDSKDLHKRWSGAALIIDVGANRREGCRIRMDEILGKAKSRYEILRQITLL